MLTNAPIHPTLPAADLGRARKFYEDILGLKVIATDPSPGVVFAAGEGTNVYVYQRGPTNADHTVAAFHVADVAATVKALQDKGVVFDEVDIPGAETTGGVTTMGNLHAAWFKDSEGNTIGVTDM
jgi:catechol 2,3-dioxygenase-like lactoylglutathione lyase family enzyme